MVVYSQMPLDKEKKSYTPEILMNYDKCKVLFHNKNGINDLSWGIKQSRSFISIYIWIRHGQQPSCVTYQMYSCDWPVMGSLHLPEPMKHELSDSSSSQTKEALPA